jgi:hypothetical protein
MSDGQPPSEAPRQPFRGQATPPAAGATPPAAGDAPPAAAAPTQRKKLDLQPRSREDPPAVTKVRLHVSRERQVAKEGQSDEQCVEARQLGVGRTDRSTVGGNVGARRLSWMSRM